jgi:YVTN family beta-propeller protein
MGFQHCRWIDSKHASAYASLAKPEAKDIAYLSGIPQHPQKSSLCLGCHSTAFDAEDWEMDPTFHQEDGVQCELCHGPGSEYMAPEVMTNPRAARAAGLKMPTREDCMNFHREKGSHTAVHGRPPFDLEKGWKAISHHTPRDWSYERIHLDDADAEREAAASQWTGVKRCAQCHAGEKMGYQFSRWRLSAHAEAFASLSTPKAFEYAREMGVEQLPTRAPECLKCHATGDAESTSPRSVFLRFEGVGCESCHGPGRIHAELAEDGPAEEDLKTGLLTVTESSCDRCHWGVHGETFDPDQAMARIAHSRKLIEEVEHPRYKTPWNLAFRPGTAELWIASEASDSVIIVDTRRRLKVAEIPVGKHVNDITFRPDGAVAYASNRLEDTVSVIETSSRNVVDQIVVGDSPHGVLTDRRGKYLYTLNTLSDSISVIDTEIGREVKRLSAGRSPWSLALEPKGDRIFVTSALPQFVDFRATSQSEVTVVDTGRQRVEDRIRLPDANLLQGIAWHPSGDFAFVTLNRTKNLVPMTRLLQGWTITNGLGIVWADGRTDQVLLDEPSRCFPDPADVAFTPDGNLALVTSSGLDLVAVVEVPELMRMLKEATEKEREEIFPNHLGKPTEFVRTHIPVGHCPRGIVVGPEGAYAYVANSLDDSVSVLDLKKLEEVERIDLGGPKVVTKTRFGERLFHNAGITFRRQFSCSTCHPDGHVNGLTFDIEPDGIGAAPVDNRTLRGILDTAPFKWEGTNPSLKRQCGPRLSVFFTRLRPYTPEELSALDEYICTIPRPPNRYRPLGAELTPPQRRGKALFERTRTNDGTVIPPEDRCVTCHFPPLYTDRRVHDVGTKMWLDHTGEFDVPHLNNIYNSAPYLHNGIAETLEEIWTRYNPDDQHGVTNDMTKDQLNDLIEYLKTL